MKTVYLTILFILLTTLASAFNPAAFPPPRWEMLGTKVVNRSLDHDVIVVTASEGRFTAIKLKVKRSPVHFLDVKVHYRNGGVEDIKVRNKIPAGGETRVINLNGKKRIITKVVFFYKTPPLRGEKAVVQLLGRH